MKKVVGQEAIQNLSHITSYDGSYVALHFVDDTVCVIDIENKAFERVGSLLNHGCVLYELGIESLEEYTERMRQEYEEYRQRQHKRKLELFEQLKQELGK
jgi:hypothetical protein